MILNRFFCSQSLRSTHPLQFLCSLRLRKERTFSTTTKLWAVDMEKVVTSKRLEKLRELMKEHKLDVYIIPSEDSHQSEYIAPCDARRAHISGFSGSAGCAVVTLDKAALATDGRYFNQAAKQLDDNWTLLKQGLEDVPTWQEWTAQQSEGGKTVGIDPTIIAAPDARKLSGSLEKKAQAKLVGVSENLIDIIWGSDRPPRPNEPVKVLDVQFAGKRFQEKLEDIRKEIEKKKGAALIISTLDDIAWLFNVRGSDIPYNPVFFSYAIITPKNATLYVESSKLGQDAMEHFGSDVTIKPYEAIFNDVKALSEEHFKSAEVNCESPATPKKLLISMRTSWALNLSIGGEEKVDEIRSPVGDAKAVKNKSELEGMRACHVRDGAALTEYFAWLEHELIVKKSTLDEVQAADKLEEIRSKHEHYVGLSFDTVSATGPNAAVIHYKPEIGNCAVIDPKAVYLCDSGAQYLDGTTDTTRTLHFGVPTAMEIEAYTLVLKGVISVDQAIFPKGTSGFALDSFARQHLWKTGLDYRHGTGHGVGSYLNVHEGPIGIGTRPQYSEVALSAGNVLSDEPGYYEDGNFGIRIENVIMVKEVSLPHKFGDKPWLGFEHVTMTPLCRKLIDVNLLTDGERKWVDEYHKEIWEKTSPYFENDERSRRWLKRETEPLSTLAAPRI